MTPQEGADGLPEGVEMRIDVFVVSPSTGIEARLGMASIRTMRAFETLAGGPEAVIKSVRRLTAEIADDFRPMNRAEIDDYKRRQEEGEDES